MEGNQKNINDLSREELIEVAKNQNQYIQSLQDENINLRNAVQSKKLAFYIEVVKNKTSFDFEFVEKSKTIIQKMLNPDVDLQMLNEEETEKENWQMNEEEAKVDKLDEEAIRLLKECKAQEVQ